MGQSAKYQILVPAKNRVTLRYSLLELITAFLLQNSLYTSSNTVLLIPYLSDTGLTTELNKILRNAWTILIQISCLLHMCKLDTSVYRDSLVSQFSCSYTGQLRTETLISRSVDLAVYQVSYVHIRDTLVSQLSCISAVTLVSYRHTGTHWSVDLAVYQQLHWYIYRHTGQLT